MRLVLVQDHMGWKWKSVHTIRSLVDRVVVTAAYPDYEDEMFGEAYKSILSASRMEKTVFVGGCSCGWTTQGADTFDVITAQTIHRRVVGDFTL